MEEKTKKIEQQKNEITSESYVFTAILRTFAGFFGGAVGAIIFFIGILLLSSQSTSVLTAGDSESITPFFVIAILMFTFIASTLSGILTAFLTYIVDKKSYKQVTSAIFQIFFLSIVVFLLIVPVYFVEYMKESTIPMIAISLHMLVGAQISILMLEIRSNTRNSLISVYSSTLSLILAAIVLILIKNLLGVFIIPFIILPLILGISGFIYGIVTIISKSLSQTYDKEFLSLSEDFGEDYGVQAIETEKPEIKEKAQLSNKNGADFLRSSNDTRR